MHAHDILITFASASAAGVLLMILAHRLRISSIVMLLLGGILLGPEFIGLVHPDALGHGLNTIVSLAVALILFEGGLTLDVKGFKPVAREIAGVLTLGVILTWMGGTLALKLIFGFEMEFCLLAASLIIVTGPTVVGPLLHRIRAKRNLHHILHWEGVLIDPIGVFIALLCFDFYISAGAGAGHVLLDFAMRFAVGMVMGLVFGNLLHLILVREWVVKGQLNIFVLVIAMVCFTLSDLLIGESGLLSVTIAGLVLGYRQAPQLHHVVIYKEELKDYLIGLLFVLLAANLKLDSFLAYGWKLVAVVLALMLVVRPINIFLSLRSSALTIKEKLFLSWIAPRGIVAASMASVFALYLSNEGVEEARFLETFTYSVIAGTVILQGFSAGWVGRMLGVLEPQPTGWLIIGAHKFARTLAHFVQDAGYNVVLVDTNALEVREASREGLVALSENAMTVEIDKHPALYGIGTFIALTPNENLNRMLCHRWVDQLEDADIFRWERETSEAGVEEHLLAGDSVWSSYPLDQWMRHHEDSIPLKTVNRIVEEKGLLYFCDGALTFSPPEEIPEGAEVKTLIYAPRRGQEKPRLPVKPEHVLFSDRTDLLALYKQMLSCIGKEQPTLDLDQILEEMVLREEEYTSLLGHGIALPHAYSEGVSEAILVVARPLHVVKCTHTDREINLIFMLVSPHGQPSEHLARISYIATLIGNEAGRQALLDAATPEDLHRVIVGN
ncbi:MAG: NhaP-type Na+/H+ or K+/H+ antiporter/mannitol [Kiritimatiellia bacterium]